jgi:uncharacterized membrane protein YkvA (DUF1232 family)
MGDSDGRYLEAFGSWLNALGRDAELLATLLSSEDIDDGARRAAAGGLNYLFKSLDLIPDGIDDIGYLDDAFVLRVAAAQAASTTSLDGPAAQLAAENRTVQSFLGDVYERLDRYVSGLRTGAARGRTVHDIIADPEVLETFLEDVKGFGASYRPPSFARDPKSLIKLRAFFDAKLPK